MTLEFFAWAVVGISTVASLIVELVKKLLDSHEKKYNPQDVSIAVSFAVSMLIGVGYAIIFDIPVSAKNVVWMVTISASVIVGAQCGYDKLFKAIYSIFKKKEEKTE
jgi:hypothetical protein